MPLEMAEDQTLVLCLLWHFCSMFGHSLAPYPFASTPWTVKCTWALYTLWPCFHNTPSASSLKHHTLQVSAQAIILHTFEHGKPPSCQIVDEMQLTQLQPSFFIALSRVVLSYVLQLLKSCVCFALKVAKNFL